jgi:hypothetical protein
LRAAEFQEFQREELRGILAIGAIASLVAVRGQLQSTTLLGFPILPLVDFLLGFWILYVLAMAIGVSGDIFGPTISDFCRSLGKLFFAAGIALITALVFTVILVYGIIWTLAGGIPTELTVLGIAIFAVALARYKTKQKLKRGRKAQKPPSFFGVAHN